MVKKKIGHRQGQEEKGKKKATSKLFSVSNDKIIVRRREHKKKTGEKGQEREQQIYGEEEKGQGHEDKEQEHQQQAFQCQ